MGYRLLRLGIYGQKDNELAASVRGVMKVALKGYAPGTVFVVFGGVLLVIATVNGPSFIRVVETPSQPITVLQPVVVPEPSAVGVQPSAAPIRPVPDEPDLVAQKRFFELARQVKQVEAGRLTSSVVPIPLDPVRGYLLVVTDGKGHDHPVTFGEDAQIEVNGRAIPAKEFFSDFPNGVPRHLEWFKINRGDGGTVPTAATDDCADYTV